MKNDRPSAEGSREEGPRRPASVRREVREDAAPPEIDFARLDLRVEVVEERISPGETNVFDK